MQRYNELADIIAILGMEELSKKTKYFRQSKALAKVSFSAVFGCRKVFRARSKYVSVKDTVAAFKAIVDGKYDSYPEQAFYMVGDIKDVEEKAMKIAGK